MVGSAVAGQGAAVAMGDGVAGSPSSSEVVDSRDEMDEPESDEGPELSLVEASLIIDTLKKKKENDLSQAYTKTSIFTSDFLVDSTRCKCLESKIVKLSCSKLVRSTKHFCLEVRELEPELPVPATQHLPQSVI